MIGKYNYNAGDRQFFLQGARGGSGDESEQVRFSQISGGKTLFFSKKSYEQRQLVGLIRECFIKAAGNYLPIQ